MQDEIDKSNLIQIINPSLTTDPNISYNALAHVIANAKNIHIPFKLVKYNKYKHNKKMQHSCGVTYSIALSYQFQNTTILSNLFQLHQT